MKNLIRRFADAIAWRVLEPLDIRLAPQLPSEEERRLQSVLAASSPAIKMMQRQLLQDYRDRAAESRRLPSWRDTGFRVMSQFDEDGVLLFLLGLGALKTRRFVDIGCGDAGLNSNVANLVFNWGFHGFAVDGDGAQIERAIALHKSHPDTALHPSTFVQAMVSRETINDLLHLHDVTGEVDVLSIDIDGNDYWVWEALDAVNPRVVVIETHVEFGNDSIVVPYDPQYRYPGRHPLYHGASVAAMASLARRKGYRMVAANMYGFNTFHLRNDIAADILPETLPEEILYHPRNRERAKLVDEIKDWKYIRV